ncbi:MAG: fumarylacetoacetate hydrolase family protein [Propylenella sp.]
MRWCRFRLSQKESYGIVENGRIEPVEGSPYGNYRRGGNSLAIDEVRLLAPCVPRTMYAAGSNYLDHDIGMAALMGTVSKPPTAPYINYRMPSAVIGPDEPIVIPADASDEIQYEGELVVVIGKQAKHLTADNALDCVLGYTIGNDFTERNWQKSDRTFWRCKNADTFKPLGPWIETDVDLEAMRTIVRINGRVATEFATGNMLFGVSEYLRALTSYVTVYPGDVLWMGTDLVPESVSPGDVIEIEITGIGVLRNTVTKERAGAA